MNTGMSICAPDCEMWKNCLHVALHLEHRACKCISRSISFGSSAGESHRRGHCIPEPNDVRSTDKFLPNSANKGHPQSYPPILQYLPAVCCCCKSPPLTKCMCHAKTHAVQVTFCANIRRYWRLRAQVHNMLMVTPFHQQQQMIWWTITKPYLKIPILLAF